MEDTSGEKGPKQEEDRCRYRYRTEAIKDQQCTRDALPGGDLCIFHEAIEKKDNDQCMKVFYDLLEAGNTNFEGFHLRELKPTITYYTEDMNFSYIRVAEETDFSEVTFRRMVRFDHATFMGPVRFTESKFLGRADLSNAKFLSKVNFRMANFSFHVDFSHSKFLNDANFSESKFNEKADFGDMKFSGDVDYNGSVFSGDVDFRDSIFLRNASFVNVKFHENCEFSGVKFKHLADFEEAIFQRRSTFHGSDTEINYGNFFNAELEHVSFKDVDLSNVNMYGASLEETYLSDAKWDMDRWGNYIIREEREAIDGKFICGCGVIHIGSGNKCEYCGRALKKKWVGKSEAYARAENAYRNFKLSLRNDGDYRKAGKFYYKEMTMKRKQYSLDKKYASWFGNTFMWLSSGYGERWHQVLLIWIIAILLFGGFYWATDSLVRGGEPVEWYENFYFSGVTFTTLGFGDINPGESNAIAQTLAMIEALLGTILMGLFLFTLARQIMR